MPILLCHDPDLQWLLDSWLLDDLHMFTRVFPSLGRRRLPAPSQQVPSSLQDHPEGPLIKLEDFLDLDVEVDLPGK